MKKMESTQKNITHGLLARLVVIMAFLFAGAIGAFAAVGPYVVFDSDAKTMTFKYGEQPPIDNKQCFTLNSKTYVPNLSQRLFLTRALLLQAPPHVNLGLMAFLS